MLQRYLCVFLIAGGLVTAHADDLPRGEFKAVLNGGEVAYTIVGQGPPMMVLTNTWGLERKRLQALFQLLEPHFTMIYFDLRGMGDSAPGTPADFGMDGARRDLEALRAHLELDKVFLLGWSAGAMNGLYFAGEHSDHLLGAVLVHGLGHAEKAESDQVGAKHEAFFKRHREVVVGLINSQAAEAEKNERIKRFLVDEWLPYICADREAGKELVRKYFEPGTYSWPHMVQMFADMENYDPRQSMAKITCPVLIVTGQEDIYPPEVIGRDAKAMAHGSHVNMAKSGHFAFLEEPEAFLAAVLDWRAKF